LDRTIVYPGAIPLETDLLNTNRNIMTALGSLTQDLFGSNTVFSGLNCVPTVPAAMSVSIAPGRVYALQNRDTIAYSSLGTDITHQLMKQGILLDTQTFSCPAPQTSGFAVNYLISASFVEQDIDPVVLPYYNAVNPAQAFSGPPVNGNSSGVAQNTIRQDTVQLTLTVGVAAANGNQMTPAAPVGATPLWVITATYGQTSITAANIAAAPNSPFAPTGGYFSAVGERYSGIQNIAGNSTLTTAALGALVNVTATGTTQTLPPAANCPNGTSITIVYMQSSGSVTVMRNGSDILIFGQGNSTSNLTLSPGEEVQFVSNGVNGWVSAGQTLSTGVTPPLGDSSNKLATTSFVQRALGNTQGIIGVQSSLTLTPSQVGSFVEINAGSGIVITLPMPTGLGGACLNFYNPSTNPVSIVAPPPSTININLTNIPAYTLPAGGTLTLMTDGASWSMIGGSGTGQLSSTGYQKFPSGLILQWGYSTAATQTTPAYVSFPISFPTSLFSITLGPAVAAANANSYSVSAAYTGTHGFNLVNNSSSSGAVTAYWQAIGM